MTLSLFGDVQTSSHRTRDGEKEQDGRIKRQKNRDEARQASLHIPARPFHLDHLPPFLSLSSISLPSSLWLSFYVLKGVRSRLVEQHIARFEFTTTFPSTSLYSYCRSASFQSLYPSLSLSFLSFVFTLSIQNKFTAARRLSSHFAQNSSAISRPLTFFSSCFSILFMFLTEWDDCLHTNDEGPSNPPITKLC